MARKYKTVDYEAALKMTLSVEASIPAGHLARFVVEIVGQLDLKAIYQQYGDRGGEPYDPPILLGLLFYGYATGVYSSRQLEKMTYQSMPFYYIAGACIRITIRSTPFGRHFWRSSKSCLCKSC